MVGKLTDDRFLSGSMMAAAMGYSKWQTPNDVLKVLKNARDGNPRIEIPVTEQMELGNRLEPIIQSITADRLGCDLSADIDIPYSYGDVKNNDYFEVSLDGLLHPTHKKTIQHDPDAGIYVMAHTKNITLEGIGVSEAKNTSVYPEDIPDFSRGVFQLHAQMLAYGAKWGALSIMYQGRTVRTFLYEPDEQIIKLMLEQIKRVYENLEQSKWFLTNEPKEHVLHFPLAHSKEPPLILDMDQHAFDNIFHNPEDEEAEETEGPLTVGDLCEAIATGDDLIRAGKKQREAAMTGLMMIMGNYAKAEVYGDPNVSYKISWPMRKVKAKPAKPAQPEKVERQKTITVKRIIDKGKDDARAGN